MNIFKGRWAQFKEELFSILYLSIVQTWWCFKFPAFQRLGTSLSIILGIISSIFGILIYIYVFVFPERYSMLYNLEFFDDAPNAHFIKRVISRWNITLSLIVMFYLWYIDFHGMSNTYYVLCCGHWIIAYLLFIQCMERYNQRIKYNS